ncbi:heavy-metal-associated domain-containing protein [Mycolicibacterium sphagni]|uniref:heavy-metal-associated domain-containing protein n=1 Tax=Mycolicibacterium sphagni TaxID=1786 RepID=UPI0027E38EC3|nr:heavy metal-associated domain-containing protein [Mycolicibacterium sphagni]
MTDVSEYQDRRIQLDVTGMTCGMCSARVAKQLNKIEGVRASVDLATKIATADVRGDVDVADLCAAVEKAGYGATERSITILDDVSVVESATRSPVRHLIEFALLFLGWLGIRGRRPKPGI